MPKPHAASRRLLLLLAIMLAGPSLAAAATDADPPSFDVAGRSPLLTVHAEGAQIYQCRPDAGGHPAWAFREPIASLIGDGQTLGRHFLGPTWAFDDGQSVKAKLMASAPGATAGDIPLLKLEATQYHGVGALSGVHLILRLNTHGGVLQGACPNLGDLRAVAYSADYVFLP